MEIYRDIVGYEGLFQVSNLGNVKSLDIVHKDPSGRERLFKSKLKKLSLGNHGYLVTNLMKGKKTTTHSVHILVARAFLNHNTYGHEIEVDHDNEDKLDNRVENLKLLTVTEHKNKSWKSRVKLTLEEKKQRKKDSNKKYRERVARSK